jgi:hypothetical protein
VNILDRRVTSGAAGVVVAALLLSFAPPIEPAAAQGFFDALFGGFNHRRPAPPPQHTLSYAEPFGHPGYVGPSGSDGGRRYSGESSSSYGGGTAFCVRTCDGRFFPIPRRAGASAAELCQSFCPASKTMVFSGSKIDHAVAPNGQRYANLDTAFVYRDKVVENCTCNGKDAFGLARVDVADDPTLRPGDIVATNDGLASYRGRSSKSDARSAEFTPIDPSKGEWARRLAEIKVRPAPPVPKIEIKPAAEAEKPARKDRRSVQLSR